MKNNIYVIYSTSYRLLKDNINKIVKDNKYSIYNQDEVEMDDILDTASYQSLFDDKNYIVVKNVTSFSSKKRGAETTEVTSKDEKLLAYLNDPNPNTILILILKDKMNGTKKISKIVKEKYNYIEIDKISIKELKDIIEKYCKSLKISLDSISINYIINSLDSNYDLIINELDKLTLLEQKSFTHDEITKIISSNILDNNFKFIDAILNKDINLAFKYYDDYLLNKNYPIIILGMLAKEFRNLLLAKTSLKKYSNNDIIKILGIAYSFQLDKVISTSYRYQEKELEDNLLYLCDINYKIKIGKTTDKKALEEFILRNAK